MDNQSLQHNQQTNTPPPNYLVWAILTTVLCCMPFGVVSIIFAAQVNSKWYSGDLEGAKNSSKNARTWAWVSFGFGLVTVLVGILLAVLGVFAGFLAEGFDF
jgi:ABC-type Fe3+ transport system permease subunit